MAYTICLLLVTVSQVADYYSTLYAIAHGAQESNPLVVAMGLMPAKVTAVLCSALVLWFIPREGRIAFTASVLVLYTWVTLHNILQVKL